MSAAEVVLLVLLAAALVAGWIFTHKGSSAIQPADVKKVVLDFDAKKKAEAQRIDGENKSALLDDLNRK